MLGISWVHRGISWAHWGMFSTSGLISWVHQGMCSTSGFSTEIERILSTCSPTCNMLSPDVLNILWCIHDTPWFTHGVPPMYLTPPMYWTHIIQGACPHDMKRVTISLFILPHPRKTWINTTGLKNKMSTLVVKSQLLTMEMINHWVSSFYIFLHLPFVPTDTLVAERLQKSSKTRLYIFQRKWNFEWFDVKIGTCKLILTETTQSY